MIWFCYVEVRKVYWDQTEIVVCLCRIFHNVVIFLGQISAVFLSLLDGGLPKFTV